MPLPSTSPALAPTRNVVLVSTMVSTTFQIFVVSVLASVLIDEFGLSRFELGLVGSLNTLVGALTAPGTGRVTDRIGARNSAIVAQLICGAGFALMAIAESVTALVISAVVLGLPQGWGNPTTNALIAERVPAGRRGVVTGIKQSGVQLGIFLAGLSLPALNSSIGWRWAMGVYAIAFTASALLPLLLPASAGLSPGAARVGGAAEEPARAYDRRAVWLIALYAFLMGTGGGAIARFMALFAEEEAGMSNATAGLVVAVSGLIGMGTRIAAGRLAEQRMRPLPLLGHLATVGAGAAVLLLLTLSVGAWLLWPFAVLFAVGHAAWNAVAMLAIIVGVDRNHAGRASGAVMFGFLGGLAVGSPIAGLVVDATGNYQPVWVAAVFLALASTAVARFADREVPRR